MRIRDWSSDVCSSDLLQNGGILRWSINKPPLNLLTQAIRTELGTLFDAVKGDATVRCVIWESGDQDRQSVVEGTSVSVRVDIGGRRIIKKKIAVESTDDRKSVNNRLKQELKRQ